MHPVRGNHASLRKFVDLADLASYLRIQSLTVGRVPAPVISPRSFRQRGPHHSDSNTCRGGNAMPTKARVELRVALDSRPKTGTRSPRNRRPRRRDVWPGAAAPEPSRRRGADSSGSGDFQPNTQMRMYAAMVSIGGRTMPNHRTGGPTSKTSSTESKPSGGPADGGLQAGRTQRPIGLSASKKPTRSCSSIEAAAPPSAHAKKRHVKR